METVEEKKVGDYLIKIFPDNDTDNPRSWDNLTKMVCFHGRYNLGDKHDYNHGDYNGWDEMEADIIRNEKPVVIKPLYLYDHSGITISTSSFNDRWDTGRIGFVFVTRKDALKEYGKKRITPAIKEKAEKVLDGEVETYDQFLTGDVYGYKIFKGEDEEEMDSCWGYYGTESAMEEAESMVSHYQAEDNKILPVGMHPRIKHSNPMKMNRAKFLQEVTVIDPDSQGEVQVSIFKHEGGGMFGIDSSYIEQVLPEEGDATVPDPLHDGVFTMVILEGV